jgi:transposase
MADAGHQKRIAVGRRMGGGLRPDEKVQRSTSPRSLDDSPSSGQHTVLDGASREEAATIGGMDRQTLRDWVIRFNEQGADGLINIPSPGMPPKLNSRHKAFLARIVEEGPIAAIHGVVRWRACNLIMRLHEEFGLSVSDDTIYRALKNLGFSHVSARPKAYKQSAEAVDAFKKTSPSVWQKSARSSHPMRVGQKNKLTYRWARKGTRPRAAHDQRTQSTYLFGAVCPERGAGAALVLPACNTEAMQLHLDEIATKITPGAHAILLLDQAGWHGAKALKVPNNISLLQLPPRAPDLNGQENIWQFMRQNWLSNRIFKSFDDIVDHCCYAWNTLIDQPWKIMSIARRDWAAVGHSN